MFNADVDAFGDETVANLFVDDDSDGAGVDVEDASGAAMVVLVGHALVDGSIDNDVNNVSDPVGSQGLGDVDGSVLFEPLSELVSGSAV